MRINETRLFYWMTERDLQRLRNLLPQGWAPKECSVALYSNDYSHSQKYLLVIYLYCHVFYNMHSRKKIKDQGRPEADSAFFKEVVLVPNFAISLIQYTFGYV